MVGHDTVQAEMSLFLLLTLPLKTMLLGWLDDPVGKRACHQARRPEFNSQHLQGRRRELTPSQCSLTCAWMLCPVHKMWRGSRHRAE